MTELLTDAEQAALKATGELYGQIAALVVDGPSRETDEADIVFHINALQRLVMAQAAGRAYPELVRLLGADGVRPQPVDDAGDGFRLNDLVDTIHITPERRGGRVVSGLLGGGLLLVAWPAEFPVPAGESSVHVSCLRPHRARTPLLDELASERQ